MVSRRTKEFYYLLLGPVMRINAWTWRTLRRPRGNVIRVQLGPGQKNYLPGWLNVDANLISAKTDIWADIRNPLPFPDGSVDFFYSHHVIEHLPDELLPKHFLDMYRCLKPGGGIRVGGPNGDTAIRKFLDGDLQWFGDWPDRRSSIGGRLANFLLCRGEHHTILTLSYLNELAECAGFDEIRLCRSGAETFREEHVSDSVLALEECDSAPQRTIIIEARRPLVSAEYPARSRPTEKNEQTNQ